MPLAERDQALVLDLRRAAEEALSFVRGMDKAAFLKDRRTQAAVEREFEIMGEAARRLSEEAKVQWPKVPFRDIIGMRNILAHDYGRVAPEKVWETVHGPLPALLKELK